MTTRERYTGRRRRLILVLGLLVLALVGGLAVIDGDGTRRGSADDAATDRTSSNARALPDADGTATASTTGGGGSSVRPTKPSGGHRAAPGPVASGSAEAAAPPSGGAGPDDVAPSGSDGESGAPFTITGSVHDLRVGVWTPVPAAITNPNGVAITVTSLRVGVSGSRNGCDGAANLETRASADPFTVPAGADAYPVPVASRPLVRLRSLATNQNRCKRQTFVLSFTGSATG